MRRFGAGTLLLSAALLGGCSTSTGSLPGQRTETLDARFLAFTLDDKGEPQAAVDRSAGVNTATLTLNSAADGSKKVDVAVGGNLVSGGTVPGASGLTAPTTATANLRIPAANDADTFLSQHSAGAYYAMGTYSTVEAGRQHMGYGVAGTPTGTLPAIVNAQYTGRATGVIAGSVTGVRQANGTVNLTATMVPDAGTISGEITDITLNGAPADMRLVLNPTQISGNGYTGTMSATTVAGAPLGNLDYSEYGGKFYGPVAVETAGTLALGANNVPTGIGLATETIHAVGMFGAAR